MISFFMGDGAGAAKRPHRARHRTHHLTVTVTVRSWPLPETSPQIASPSPRIASLSPRIVWRRGTKCPGVCSYFVRFCLLGRLGASLQESATRRAPTLDPWWK